MVGQTQAELPAARPTLSRVVTEPKPWSVILKNRDYLSNLGWQNLLATGRPKQAEWSRQHLPGKPKGKSLILN
jgi:hypothetical protein